MMEDRGSIQIGLFHILNAVAHSKLDPRRAGLLLYGLQIASKNVALTPLPAGDEMVSSVTPSSDGEDLAPENRICQPLSWVCKDCTFKDDCKDYQIQKQRDEKDSRPYGR
jgi:hypothetical protein